MFNCYQIGTGARDFYLLADLSIQCWTSRTSPSSFLPSFFVLLGFVFFCTFFFTLFLFVFMSFYLLLSVCCVNRALSVDWRSSTSFTTLMGYWYSFGGFSTNVSTTSGFNFSLFLFLLSIVFCL